MSNDDKVFRPDFLSYHKSLRSELDVVKDRVRNLIQHWATDGAFKEAALRSVLRRHLPESLLIGTGFVVTRHRCSTQIDILIVDSEAPTLFKDGDLLIVTPEVVRGIIEVKTTLSGPQGIEEACLKLCEVAAICDHPRNINKRQLWTGLFVYDGDKNQEQNLLAGVYKAHEACLCTIDAIGYGSDVIAIFREKLGLSNKESKSNCWATWNVPGMAPSYFVGQMLDHWFELGAFSDSSIWMPGQNENQMTFYTSTDDGGEIVEH